MVARAGSRVTLGAVVVQSKSRQPGIGSNPVISLAGADLPGAKVRVFTGWSRCVDPDEVVRCLTKHRRLPIWGLMTITPSPSPTMSTGTVSMPSRE